MICVLLRTRSRPLFSSLLFLTVTNTPIPKTRPNPNPNPFRELLTQSPLYPFPNSLSFSFFSTSRPRPRSRTPRSRRPKRRSPAPIDQSQLDDAISQLPPRFSSSDLAAALAALPDPRLCLPLLTWAHHHHPRIRPDPAVFLAAVKKLGTAGLYPEMASVASLAFALFPSSLPEPVSNTIIYFYAEARMLSKAIGVYKLMRRSPDPAARPTAATYSLLFTALLGRGSDSYIHHVYMDTIRSLFRQMVESGVAPERHALNAMVKGYVQSLHLNDALRVFHQMLPLYGCEPDEVTYSYLVHGLCAQGRTRNARQLFDEMREKGLVLSSRACNSLVSALAMAGEMEAAVRTMWEVGGMGRAMDGITCRALLGGICRQGRGVQDAVGLLREMNEREFLDGRMYRELLHWVQDEFGDLDGEEGLRCERDNHGRFDRQINSC